MMNEPVEATAKAKFAMALLSPEACSAESFKAFIAEFAKKTRRVREETQKIAVSRVRGRRCVEDGA